VIVLRADAQRNLERVLDAATAAFTASGPEASIDDIAHRAGVGHATVLRRFPTKDALMLAVIDRRVTEIRGAAEEALASDDPGQAFFDFVWKVAELHAGARGLHECVAACGDKPGAADLERLSAKIVSRAQRAGAVRPDIKAADVPALVRAALFAAPERQWRRYVEVVLDGLRLEATSAKPPSPGR
jgi:AcrR family transcriptional regulator